MLTILKKRKIKSYPVSPLVSCSPSSLLSSTGSELTGPRIWPARPPGSSARLVRPARPPSLSARLARPARPPGSSAWLLACGSYLCTFQEISYLSLLYSFPWHFYSIFWVMGHVLLPSILPILPPPPAIYTVLLQNFTVKLKIC